MAGSLEEVALGPIEGRISWSWLREKGRKRVLGGWDSVSKEASSSSEGCTVCPAAERRGQGTTRAWPGGGAVALSSECVLHPWSPAWPLVRALGSLFHEVFGHVCSGEVPTKSFWLQEA